SCLCFSASHPHLDLPSFPTRRSSDLGTIENLNFENTFQYITQDDTTRQCPHECWQFKCSTFTETRHKLCKSQTACKQAQGRDCIISGNKTHLMRIFKDRKSTRLNSSHVKI